MIAVLALGGEAWITALRYDRAGIHAGEWWRWVSGSLVHAPGNVVSFAGYSLHAPWHLFLNELAILVLVLLCPERHSYWEWLRRVLILSLGMSLGLYFFAPDLVWYVGLSGVLHGLFVLGLVPQILRRDVIALGCLLYLLGKLGYELIAGAAVSDSAAIGMPVALPSHLWGSVAGLVYGIASGQFLLAYRRAQADAKKPAETADGPVPR